MPRAAARLRYGTTGLKGRKNSGHHSPPSLTLPLSLKGSSFPIRFSAWWHSLSRRCENPSHRLKTCATKNLLNQPLPHLGVMLSPQGRRKQGILARRLPSTGLLLALLGRRRRFLLHMVPESLQAGHFLGLQRVSTLLPHFSQVKTAMGYLQIRLSHRLTPRRGRRRLGLLPGKAAALVAI